MEKKEKTEAGIYIPEDSQERKSESKVLEIGPKVETVKKGDTFCNLLTKC